MGSSGAEGFSCDESFEPDELEPEPTEPDNPEEWAEPQEPQEPPEEPFERGERKSQVRMRQAKPKPPETPKRLQTPASRKKPKQAAKPPAKSKTDSAWQTQLTRTPRGAIAPTSGNAALILASDPAWLDVVAYDAFADRAMKLRAPQWHKTDRPGKFYRNPGPWTDLDAALLRMWLERCYDLVLRQSDVDTALKVHAHRQVRNGPVDYLKPLAWDKVERLPRALTTYAGAADTAFTRAVGVMWFISAVARVFDPGCQVDHGIILEGEQGLGKSSFLRLLVPDRSWFLVDIGSEFGKLDSFQKLRGKWIVEMSELDSLTRSQLSAAKAFWTNSVDTYRRSYGSNAEDFPRRCVFAGTTNKDEYLTDDTGNRRFWPVLLARLDRERLAADRDQLWAEAVVRYRRGEGWHITDPALLNAARREQDKRMQTHPFERPIAEFLQTEEPRAKGVTTHDVMSVVLKLKIKDMTPGLSHQVASCLKRLGWAPDGTRKRIGKHQVRRYFLCRNL